MMFKAFFSPASFKKETILHSQQEQLCEAKAQAVRTAGRLTPKVIAVLHK